MPDNAPIIRFPSEEEQQAALNEFAREMQRVKERKESVPAEKLDEALETITDYLKTGWSTGGGRRLRQFVWSLWNGFHLINLYDLSSGLDGTLTDAVIVVFNAAMVDVLSEDHKRRVLKESGEFARWEQASAEIPEDEEVLYPPFPISTDGLRRVAHSAEQNDRRIEQQRRAEQAHEANEELESATERDQLRSLRRLRDRQFIPLRRLRDRQFIPPAADDASCANACQREIFSLSPPS